MKVLFLTKYYPPAEGGIERYSHLLCTDLRKRGIDVEVVAASDNTHTSAVDRIDGVTVHRMGRLVELSGVPVSPKLPLRVRQIAPRFDLIHMNFPSPLTELTYQAFCGEKKAVLTYHSDILRQQVFLKMYRPFVNRLLGKMSAIIVQSPNYVHSSAFLSQHLDRCCVIPSIVDTDSLSKFDSKQIEELRARYGDFVLFVGRLVYYKGVEYLIRAMEYLEHCTLVIIGRGKLEVSLRRLAKEKGLDSKIVFLGKVSDERLRSFYQACRVFVLPSVARSESFGLALAEAMACGKPVISTELSTGTSFVNLEGKTGFVVAPRDASALAAKIDLLSRDLELCRRFGENARLRAKDEFSIGVVAKKTIDLYEKVLE